MTTPAPWPRSVLPRDRDHRWNVLLDLLCQLWRCLRPGDRVVSLAVTVRGDEGVRVYEAGGLVIELENERGEEEAC